MSEKNVQERINELSKADKNLLRLYINLPEDELIKQAAKFGNSLMMYAPKNNDSERNKKEKVKKIKEYAKQLELYQLTYIVKKMGLTIPKSGGKTRHHKRRGTRKLKR
jgi:hypothetical protein